jgi:mono/diheme cytochrome c family protein
MRLTNLVSTLALACAAIGLSGCGGSTSSPASAASTSNDGEAQAERGAKLYAANCASCHGQSGQGQGTAPAVVGNGALPLDPRPEQKFRKVQFHTAGDVGAYVAKNMPPKAPGSLADAEYWDILAFDLKANGVAVGGKHIDATTAAEIKLH